MITATIFINGNPVLSRSAWRIKGKDDEECIYRTDAGDLIKHKPDDGAKFLAKKMIDTIKER